MTYCFKYFIPVTNGPPTGSPPTSGPSGESFNNISFQLIKIVRDEYSEIFSKINFNFYSLGLNKMLVFDESQPCYKSSNLKGWSINKNVW